MQFQTSESNEQRRKIMVIFSSNHVAYPFTQARAFNELSKDFDLYLAYHPASITIDDLDTFAFKELIPIEMQSRRRKRIRGWMMFLNMWGFRNRVKDFGDSYRRIFEMDMYQRNKLHLLLNYYIAGFSEWSTTLILSLVEKCLGLDKSLDAVVQKVKPDLMIGMLCGYSWSDVEPIKVAKKHEIPIMYLQGGWDNIPHRGVLLEKMDYLGVWGYQSAVLAEYIHKISKKKIFLMGSPFAEILRQPHSVADADIRKKMDLPANKMILFFAGVSHAANEVGLLKMLEGAIESGKLGNCCVFYRPHPLRHHNLYEDNFFDQKFKHVVLDPVLRERFREHILERKLMYDRGEKLIRDYKYNREILSVASIIVSPISTFIAEGLYFGIPSVLIAFVDQRNEKYGIRYGMATSQFYHSIPGIFHSLSPTDLIDKCSEALAFQKNEKTKSLLESHLRSMSYEDQYSLGERISNAVHSIFSTNGVSPVYHYFQEPLVNVDKKENVVSNY